MKWDAWGDPEQGEAALRRNSESADSRRSASGTSRFPNSSPTRSSCDRRHCRPLTATRWPTSSARRTAASTTRARLLRAGGKSTLDLLRRRDPGVQDAPDAVLLPGDEDEIADDPAAVRAAQHRRRPVRRRHQRRRRPRSAARSVQGRDLARSAQAERTALPRRDLRRGRTRRRRHGAGCRTAARRTRLLARALPAELPVRDDRRIRRNQVVRAGLGGLRPIQRHGPRPARDHACGRARPRPGAGVRGGPGSASAVDRLRRRVRHHHPRPRPGSPGACRHPLRSVVVPRLRHRRRTPCAPSPKPVPAQPCCGSPTRPRPA